MRYELRHPKESFHNTSITMDCDQCVVATLHGKPMFTKVGHTNLGANRRNLSHNVTQSRAIERTPVHVLQSRIFEFLILLGIHRRPSHRRVYV